jgi:hypothetical protein
MCAFKASFSVLFDWDSAKNEILKDTRQTSFETIVVHLGRGDVWKNAEHPDQVRYPGQWLFFVVINDYVYVVPYEIRDAVFWLITIIPSRRATAEYRKEKPHEVE